jgi:hypothetical protein
MWRISWSNSIIRWQDYRVAALRLAESNFRRTQAVAPRMALDVLVPEDRQGDVLALELAMDRRPVGLDLPTVTALRAGVGEQPGLERGSETHRDRCRHRKRSEQLAQRGANSATRVPASNLAADRRRVS